MKTSNVVLDSSVILAFLNHEQGGEILEEYISHSLISAVNFTEVISVLIRFGTPSTEAVELANEMPFEIIPFDKKQAIIAADFTTKTKSFGLSLGDNACLALAKSKNLPVLTADKIWSKLDIGVTVQLIR